MNIKQKTLIVFTVAAFSFLGYQVYQLVTEDISSNPVPTQKKSVQKRPMRLPQQQSKKQQQKQLQLQAALLTMNKPLKEAPLTIHPEKAQVIPMKSASIVTMPSQPMATSKLKQKLPTPTAYHKLAMLKTQQLYLQLVNQYELAKMKRQLLDEEAAIANAQNRIAQMNKKTRALNGGALVQTTSLSGVVSTIRSAQKRPVMLSYVGKQQGEWSAMLMEGNHYQSVNVGSELPDGSRVAEINRHGVMLASGKHREWVTFDGVIAMKALSRPTVKKAIRTTETSNNKQRTRPHAKQRIKLRPPIKVARTALRKAGSKRRLVYKPKINRHSMQLKQSVVLGMASHKPTPSVLDTLNKLFPSPKPAPSKFAPKVTASALLASPGTYAKNEQYLMRLPPNDYTIQLIGSYFSDVVENFAKANHLNTNDREYYIYNDGRRWHMLLYGDYKTLLQAKEALANLPPSLKIEGPWIRKLSDVQRDIRGRLHRLTS